MPSWFFAMDFFPSDGQGFYVNDPERGHGGAEYHAAVDCEASTVEVRERQSVAPGGEELAYKIGHFTSSKALIDGKIPISCIQRDIPWDGEADYPGMAIHLKQFRSLVFEKRVA